jgi:hypothetical protein
LILPREEDKGRGFVPLQTSAGLRESRFLKPQIAPCRNAPIAAAARPFDARCCRADAHGIARAPQWWT